MFLDVGEKGEKKQSVQTFIKFLLNFPNTFPLLPFPNCSVSCKFSPRWKTLKRNQISQVNVLIFYLNCRRGPCWRLITFFAIKWRTDWLSNYVTDELTTRSWLSEWMTGWLIDRLNARILQLCLDLSLTLKSIAFAKNLSPIILFLFCSFSTVLFFFHVSNADLKNMKCIQGNLICDIKGETSLFCSSLIKLTFLLQIKSLFHLTILYSVLYLPLVR